MPATPIRKGSDYIATRAPRPLDGGGDGGDDGGMEARVARLEAHVSHIDQTMTEMKADVRDMRNDMRGDFRLLFGALITVALGLTAIMAKGFGWL